MGQTRSRYFCICNLFDKSTLNLKESGHVKRWSFPGRTTTDRLIKPVWPYPDHYRTFNNRLLAKHLPCFHTGGECQKGMQLSSLTSKGQNIHSSLQWHTLFHPVYQYDVELNSSALSLPLSQWNWRSLELYGCWLVVHTDWCSGNIVGKRRK
jgi:hypothetical protein